jgi:glycosyltransferase involved in cell wall biosynthesis
MTDPERIPVIAGLPEWTATGPPMLTAGILRGLGELGWPTRILLTETATVHIDFPQTLAARPDDLAFDELPVAREDSWGERWNAVIRYLEERAPCIYLMAGDWRHNIVAPRLSNRVRLVGFVHADYELEYEQAARLGYCWDAAVAVSEVLEFNVAQRVPHLVPRLTTICNGVAALADPPIKPHDGPLRIVYCGELRRRQKRLHDLVDVARRLDELGVEFELTFVGDGELRTELEEEAAEFAARRPVRFLGVLPHAEVLEEVARHHVVLMTSEFEGLSMALLEAMSRGCVPVVSALATQSLLVQDGVNGFCAPVGDGDAFARRLAELAADRALLARLAAAAFETIADGRYRREDMLRSYDELLLQLAASPGPHRRFVRPRGDIGPPPQEVGGIGILPGHYGHELAVVNALPRWPDAPAPVAAVARAAACAPPLRSPTLADHKIIVANPLGYVSGVDVFASHLVRALLGRGFDARILGGEAARLPGGHLRLALDVPVDPEPVAAHEAWPVRWRAMMEYLEAQAPCFYLPNYEYAMAAIVPRLPDAVKAVTIAHSDDPTYYDLVARIGRFSNVIGAVSQAIAANIAALIPDLSPRLAVLPYGVEFPAPPVTRAPNTDGPLRLVYAGRVTQYQKRVRDLIAIATELAERDVPFELTVIGDGDELGPMLELGTSLMLARRLRFLGTLRNDEVSLVLRESDVLVMPSAFEGLPLALLEAMGAGVVPVLSDIRSGVPDLIADGENGLLAPVGDPSGFAERIARLHADRAELQRMSLAARRTALPGEYGIAAMTDRYLAAFQHALDVPFMRPPGAFAPPAHLAPELAWRVQARRSLRRRLRPLRAAFRGGGS